MNNPHFSIDQSIDPREEVKSLRDQLQRALLELKAYQTKYPSAYINDIKLDENLPPWITSSEIMTPLLVAYDSRIKELESIATLQATQLEKFRIKVQDVVQENEQLREAASVMGVMSSSESTLEGTFDPDNDGISSIRNATGLGDLKEELVNELNERLDILVTENSLINEQKGLLIEELEAFQRDLGQRTQEYDELMNKCIDLESNLNKYQHLFKQAEHDRDLAANKAINFSESLGTVQLQYDAIKEENVKLYRKIEEMDKYFKDEQNKFNLYKTQVEKEGIDCVTLAQRAEERSQELKNQLTSKTNELETTQEVLRKLRREYQATRQDAEGMLQVMSGLERQVASYVAKEDEFHKLSRECKDKVDEALSIKEQSEAREASLKKEIERLFEQRKELQMKQRIEIDKAVDNALLMAEKKMKTLEKEMEDVAIVMGKRRSDTEIAFRDAESFKLQLNKCIQLRDNERRAHVLVGKEMEVKIQSLIDEINTKESHCRDALSNNIHYRNTIDSLRSQLEDVRMSQVQALSIKENEIVNMKSSLRDCKKELSERVRLQTKAEKELDDLRGKFQFEVTSSEKRLEEENRALRKRANETEKTVKDLEQNLEMTTIRRTHLIESVKESNSATISQMENDLQLEKEKVHEIMMMNRELEIKIDGLQLEKHDLESVVEESEKIIKALEKHLNDTRQSVVDLTEQLSQSYDARKKGALLAAQKIETLHYGENETKLLTNSMSLHNTNKSKSNQYKNEIKKNNIDESDNSTINEHDNDDSIDEYIENVTEETDLYLPRKIYSEAKLSQMKEQKQSNVNLTGGAKTTTKTMNDIENEILGLRKSLNIQSKDSDKINKDDDDLLNKKDETVKNDFIPVTVTVNDQEESDSDVVQYYENEFINEDDD